VNDADTARFWSKVQQLADDACWPWLAGRFLDGYGAFRVDDRTVRPHRMVWQMEHGEVPAGFYVKHKCGSRLCCNLTHLYLAPVSKRDYVPHQKQPPEVVFGVIIRRRNQMAI
jgi:hypothetical protein